MKFFGSKFAAALAALIAAPFFLSGETAGNEGPAYLRMIPLMTVKCDSVRVLASDLSEGLGGIGFPVSVSQAESIVADAALLQDISFADPAKPAFVYFLVTPDDQGTPPVCASRLPLSRSGRAELLETIYSSYTNIVGNAIRVCRDPRVEGIPEVLYYAVADGYGMFSTTLDGVRWMAYNQRGTTLPVVDVSRGAAVEAVVNGPLGAEYLRRFSSSLTNVAPRGVSLSNFKDNLSELASVLDKFVSVSFSLDSDLGGISLSLRLESPYNSEFDLALRKLKLPGEGAVGLIPNYASNLSISSLPGLLAALPERTRRWLALLSLDCWFAGLSIFPGAPDLDSSVMPFLKGESASMFLSDTPTLKLGNITFYDLSDPAGCATALNRIFSEGGPADKVKGINPAVRRKVGSVTVFQYDLDISGRGKAQYGGGDTISAVSEMTHVEIAVCNGRLAVAYGRNNLIDHWLNGGVHIPTTRAFDYRIPFDKVYASGAHCLGGGVVYPVDTFKRIFSYVESLRSFERMIPRPGNGFFWTLARRGSAAEIDLYFSSNEILACLAYNESKPDFMQGVFSQFIINSINRGRIGIDHAPEEKGGNALSPGKGKE